MQTHRKLHGYVRSTLGNGRKYYQNRQQDIFAHGKLCDFAGNVFQYYNLDQNFYLSLKIYNLFVSQVLC